jgi:DNA-binding response OmpR family regulator
MDKVILFADNERTFVDVHARLLERAGYKVLPALTLEDAERKLEEERVHLALIDIRMIDDNDPQDISGRLLAEKDKYRPLPKIMLTGFSSYEHVRTVMSADRNGWPAAVEFLDKDEGADAVLEAVQKTFEDHVRISWDLQVRWGSQDELHPPCLVSLMAPGVSTEKLSGRTGEVEDLFRRLFHDYDQLTLGSLLCRGERRIVLTAFGYRNGRPEERFLVVCGQRGDASASIENHELFIPERTSVRFAHSGATIHFEATAHRLSGCDIGQTLTFERFYREQPTDGVMSLVERLFGETLRRRYKEGLEELERPLDVFCRERLESDGKPLTRAALEKRVAAISQAALSAGVEGFGSSVHRLQVSFGDSVASYPNPVPYLYEDRVALSPPTLCGSLRPSWDVTTVLAEGTRQGLVVALGQKKKRPLVFEFAAFESLVKFDAWAEASLSRRHGLEKALLELGVDSPATDIEHEDLDPGTLKALRVIATIRSQAVSLVGAEEDPYLVGLLFCAVERCMAYDPQLNYTRPEMIVFTHALLSMGMICQRLFAWEDQAQDLPEAARESLWLDTDNKEVWVEGRCETLTEQRYCLLKYMYDRVNQLCERADLARDVFDMEFSDYHPRQRKDLWKDTINTAIRRLRQDVEPDPRRPKYIRTVRGSGYKLVLEDTTHLE